MAILSDNMRGALLMTGSMTAFTVNDAFMKALSDELPLFQSIFMRSVGVLLCLSVIGLMMTNTRYFSQHGYLAYKHHIRNRLMTLSTDGSV